MCLLTALCTGSSGGQWEDLYWADPLHWEKALWGERADQRSGEGWSESGWRTPGATGAGDCWAEEERCWAGAAFTHRGSHPFPPGNITGSLTDCTVYVLHTWWGVFLIYKDLLLASAQESVLRLFSVCLQSCQSLCVSPGPGDLPSITVSPHVSFEAVSKSVSELKERLEDVFKMEVIKVSGRGWWTNPAAESVFSHCTQHTGEVLCLRSTLTSWEALWQVSYY